MIKAEGLITRIGTGIIRAGGDPFTSYALICIGDKTLRTIIAFHSIDSYLNVGEPAKLSIFCGGLFHGNILLSIEPGDGHKYKITLSEFFGYLYYILLMGIALVITASIVNFLVVFFFFLKPDAPLSHIPILYKFTIVPGLVALQRVLYASRFFIEYMRS